MKPFDGIITELRDDQRCAVNMIHADQSAARCTRHRKHVEQDTDHTDEHGHRAPVLVSQSTIAEALAIEQEADAARSRAELADRISAHLEVVARRSAGSADVTVLLNALSRISLLADVKAVIDPADVTAAIAAAFEQDGWR
jgi:hypothetical protein